MRSDMVENCSACRFFAAITTEAFPTADGMCRRWAPQGPVIGCAKNGWQVFPPMQRHQWCGEFRPAAAAEIIENRIAVASAREAA